MRRVAISACAREGLYTATVRVPRDSLVHWAFYRFRTTLGRIVQSREAFTPGDLRVNRATVVDAYYTFNG